MVKDSSIREKGKLINIYPFTIFETKIPMK